MAETININSAFQKIKRVQENGLRFYEVTEGDNVIAKLPSVTTILGETKDKSSLEKWKKRVGEKEANRISSLSMSRGTIMHRLIELYKTETFGESIERLGQLIEVAKDDDEVNEFKDDENGKLYLEEAWKFFFKFWSNSSDYFDTIKEVIEAETFLWTIKDGGWAGTVDNISELIDGQIKIIDYKNSIKPKREEWVLDYYLQAAAYFIAYWSMYGKKADGAEIWIANEVDNEPQKFTLTQQDLESYAKEFIKRRQMFQEKHNI